jgi:hypothetical protein
MLRLTGRLLALWPPLGGWADAPVGGPYTVGGAQAFCPGPATQGVSGTFGAAGCPPGGAAGQSYVAGAAGGQVTA